MHIDRRRRSFIDGFVGSVGLTRTDAMASERRMLLSTLVTHFLHASLLTAVSTSIINALIKGIPVSVNGSSEALVPIQPEDLTMTLGRLAALGVPRGPLTGIHNFYLRSAFSKRLTRSQFAGLDGLIGADDKALPGAQQVWMSACGAALLGIHYLPECSDYNIKEHEAPIRVISDAIAQIGKGYTPFVRSDGSVYVPGWFDVRRSTRRRLDCPSTVRHEGKDIPITLLDISAGGIGFRSSEAIPGNAFVRLWLPDGRSTEAQIVWNRQDHYGATFALPLSDSDLLLH